MTKTCCGPHGSTRERKTGGDGLQRLSRSMIIGIEGGMNYSMFSQTMNRTGSALPDSPENVLESGSGISPYFGIMADFPMSNSIGIQVRALYDPKKVSRELNGNVEVFSALGALVDMPTLAKYTLDVTGLTLAAALRIDLTPSVFLTAGPLAQFNVGDIKRTDTWSVTKPDSFNITIDYSGNRANFKSVSRETTVAANFLPNLPPIVQSVSNFNTVRIGLEFGLGGKIDIDKNIWLVPQVRYQHILSAMYNNFSAEDFSRLLTNQQSTIEFSNPKLHSLQIGLGLWFGI